MMKVRVLFFGATAVEAGTSEAELKLEEGAGAEAVFSEIIDRYPELIASRDRRSLLFAVNQEYVKGDELLKNGDELAVFTAVSGG